MAGKTAEPNPEGRPTKYKPEYAIQAEKLSKLGCIDREIAEYLEVTESTLNLWKLKHPEFSESIKKGKAIADAEVSAKLYERAIGYSHEDLDIRVIKGKIVKTKLIKHYPPETIAAIFWLKNRNPEKWRDKQEMDHNIKSEQPLFGE